MGTAGVGLSVSDFAYVFQTGLGWKRVATCFKAMSEYSNGETRDLVGWLDSAGVGVAVAA